MMIHRLTAVSIFAVLNALAFPSKSEAQATSDVNFNGNITATIAIEVGSPANPTPSIAAGGFHFLNSSRRKSETFTIIRSFFR